mgnify:CR=1 FL=1
MKGGEAIFLQDLQWFGITPDLIARSSDRMDIYYDYMQQLVEMGHAYVCVCEKEAWKALILDHTGCPCREMGVEEQRMRFQKMLTHEYQQGDAVLRIKTDLNLDDPSQIDWPLARIVDEPQHYLVKDRYLWPVYNFASAIDDHLMNVTLIIRGQEHYQNMLKQEWLYKHFGWTYPHAYHYGKLLMKDAELSKSKLLAGMASGKYSGWDDPQLYTVSALRRKGFAPQAFIDMMIDLGVKPNDTTLNLELLSNYNRKHVQGCPVIPFVADHIPVHVDFVPEMNVTVDNEEYSLKQGTQSFFVPKKDTLSWNVGTTLRLRNAYVIKINDATAHGFNAQFVSTAKIENTTQTPWITNGTDVRIVMPTGEKIVGKAGDSIRALQEGDEVFFPHFGYCRVDAKKENHVELWFTHA